MKVVFREMAGSTGFREMYVQKLLTVLNAVACQEMFLPEHAIHRAGVLQVHFSVQ
jgi:hypothetical protein